MAAIKSDSLRVLLMDDDPTQRYVYEQLLSRADYAVSAADSGEMALQMLREARRLNTVYDVALLDLTIPGGKGGKEIVADIQQIFPEIRCVAMSGNTADPLFEEPGRYGFHEGLKKPFLSEDLLLILKKFSLHKNHSTLEREGQI